MVLFPFLFKKINKKTTERHKKTKAFLYFCDPRITRIYWSCLVGTGKPKNNQDLVALLKKLKRTRKKEANPGKPKKHREQGPFLIFATNHAETMFESGIVQKRIGFQKWPRLPWVNRATHTLDTPAERTASGHRRPQRCRAPLCRGFNGEPRFQVPAPESSARNDVNCESH